MGGPGSNPKALRPLLPYTPPAQDHLAEEKRARYFLLGPTPYSLIIRDDLVYERYRELEQESGAEKKLPGDDLATLRLSHLRQLGKFLESKRDEVINEGANPFDHPEYAPLRQRGETLNRCYLHETVRLFCCGFENVPGDLVFATDRLGHMAPDILAKIPVDHVTAIFGRIQSMAHALELSSAKPSNGGARGLNG